MKTFLLLLIVLTASVAAHAEGAPTSSASAPGKLWATDLAAFINQNPRGHWIVGVCAQPALSAAEAESFARANAADQIIPLIDQSVRRNVPASLIRQQVIIALNNDGWIADRIVQSDDRPYGTIWHESILLDGSPRKLDELSRRIQLLARREQGRRAAMLGGGSVLFILVFVTYLLLNWLTRGYLRLRLAMILIAIMAIGMALIAGLTHLV